MRIRAGMEKRKAVLFDVTFIPKYFGIIHKLHCLQKVFLQISLYNINNALIPEGVREAGTGQPTCM